MLVQQWCDAWVVLCIKNNVDCVLTEVSCVTTNDFNWIAVKCSTILVTAFYRTPDGNRWECLKSAVRFCNMCAFFRLRRIVVGT